MDEKVIALLHDTMEDKGITEKELLDIGFSEKIVKTPELKGYYYDVVVVNGSHESEMATSNKVIVGQALTPPFDEDFTTQEGFDRFTVVDGNNDGKTWKRLHKTYSYSGTTIDYAQIFVHTAIAVAEWWTLHADLHRF